MLNELKTKGMQFYKDHEDEIISGFCLAGMIMISYNFALWKGRAEGLNVGSRALVKMAEQVNKIESK